MVEPVPIEVRRMKFARPRFSLRSLMIVILISGAVIALVERQWRFKRTAAAHLAREAEASERAVQVMRPLARGSTMDSKGRIAHRTFRVPGAEQFRDRCLAVAAHHAEMALKYGTASRRPWLAVAADPPAPDLPEIPD